MEEIQKEYRDELFHLNLLLTEITNSPKIKNVADYLITTAKINNFSMHVMEAQKLKNFFQNHAESEMQFCLFQIFKIAKEEKEIDALEKIQSYIEHPNKSFHIIHSLIDITELASEIFEKKNQRLIEYIIKFILLLKNTNLQYMPPKVLYRLLKKQPIDVIDNFIELLEYFYGLSPSQRFLKPLMKRKNFLEKELMKRKKEELSKKQKKEKIKKQITQDQSTFYYANEKDKILIDCEENNQYYWNLLLNQNENFLKLLKGQLEQKKKQWNNEWLNIFLDQGYNATILSNAQLEKVKNSLTQENLKQILEMLKMPIFQFLQISHPLFVDIITQTSKEVLFKIGKEIKEENLKEEYIKKYPEILFAPYFRYYEKNRDLANSIHLELSFCWNNNLLLLHPNTFEKTIHLIDLYGSRNIPYTKDTYFDDLDHKIEQRDTTSYNQFPSYLSEELKKVLEENKPIDLEDTETNDNIIFLDTYFKKDELRYQFASHIISRRKVQRIFKFLNTIQKQTEEENLIDAILYHCSLFEFEVEEIKEMIKTSKRLLKK